MRIGILETGHPPDDVDVPVPSYPTMIRAALGPGYAYREFDAAKGDLPKGRSPVDAYVLTGSASAVYDNEPWIAHLRDWLRDLNPATPLVGICFGHQIMAGAYGGVVTKAENGWAHGLHEYNVRWRERWMDDVHRIVLPVAHQDQVTTAPAAARVIATSEACPYAVLSYSNRRALSFQGHPEFARDYAGMLIN